MKKSLCARLHRCWLLNVKRSVHRFYKKTTCPRIDFKTMTAASRYEHRSHANSIRCYKTITRIAATVDWGLKILGTFTRLCVDIRLDTCSRKPTRIAYCFRLLRCADRHRESYHSHCTWKIETGRAAAVFFFFCYCFDYSYYHRNNAAADAPDRDDAVADCDVYKNYNNNTYIVIWVEDRVARSIRRTRARIAYNILYV
jgi:hypothetical protein